MMKEYDAIVVGAGPAGSSAARRLALRGRRVLMLDSFRFPREKACGGGLTGHVGRYLDFDIASVIEARVTSTVCVFKGVFSKRLEPAGLNVEMIRRPTFDALLASKAVEAGAEFIQGARFVTFVKESGKFKVATTAGTHTATTLIAADGAASMVSRRAGLRRDAPLGIAMDAELIPRRGVIDTWNDVSIFDFGIVPRGYGWAFPKRGGFSIGVGTVDGKFPTAKRCLFDLIERHEPLRDPESFVIRSAPIPFWNRHDPLAGDGVFLAGDAAGLVDPLSGEGISYAVRSGLIAADHADRLLGGAEGAEAAYTAEIEERISKGFAYAKKFAEIFFKHPVASYLLGVRSSKVNDHFAKLIAGDLDYAKLYEEVRDSSPGRLYRLIKPLLGR